VSDSKVAKRDYRNLSERLHFCNPLKGLTDADLDIYSVGYMREFDVATIPIGTSFSNKVFLDGSYIVLAPHEPVTTGLLDRLAAWGYTTVFSNGANESESEAVAAERAIEKQEEAETLPAAEDTGGIRYYFELIDRTQTLIDRFRAGDGLNTSEIRASLQRCMEVVDEYRDEILRYPEYPFPIQDYLAVHLTNCAILTAATGGYLSREKSHKRLLVEAAYLHDIGMAELPADLYEKQDHLTAPELERVRSHPLLGYRALKQAEFSEQVCLAALEHHEWLDGTGYPSGKKGPQTSALAKVVAVVCSYDAATSSRSYKEAVDSHAAISDLLLKGSKRYHPSVVKAFAHATSAYAPGAFVRLSNGAAGLVIRANDAYPKMPTVRLLFDEHGLRVNTHRIVETHSDSRIAVDHEIGPEELSNYYDVVV
jgi:HD-GYP domain-containing protein (c-di-GMP phosphodiesterase class II)